MQMIPENSVPHPCAFFLVQGWETSTLIRQFSRRSHFGQRNPHSPSLPSRRHQLRLDLNNPSLTQRPSSKTRPRPVFRLSTKPPFHWIPMNVSKLHYESLVIPHIAIEVPNLPKRQSAFYPLTFLFRFDGHFCLQYLNEPRQHHVSRFADQQMDMLRHDDVPIDAHREALSALLQCDQEHILHVHLCQMRQPMVTAESDKVGLSGIVETLQSCGQKNPQNALEFGSILRRGFVLSHPRATKKAQGWGTEASRCQNVPKAPIPRRSGPPLGTPAKESHVVEQRLYPQGAYLYKDRFRPIPVGQPSPWVPSFPMRPLKLQGHPIGAVLLSGPMHRRTACGADSRRFNFPGIQTLAQAAMLKQEDRH